MSYFLVFSQLEFLSFLTIGVFLVLPNCLLKVSNEDEEENEDEDDNKEHNDHKHHHKYNRLDLVYQYSIRTPWEVERSPVYGIFLNK